MKSYKNFVGGKLVKSVEGREEAIISPVDERTLGKVPLCDAKDVDRAVGAAAEAFEKWQDTTPGERSLMLLKLADILEKNGDELAALEADNVGKPIGLAKSEVPFMVDNLRFFAGACRCLEGKAAGEYLAGYTEHDPAGAGGRSGLDRALELPPHDGRVEDRPGAGGRQHGRPEALRADAADDRSGWPRSPRTCSRRASSTSSRATASPRAPALVKHPRVDMVSLTGDVATGKGGRQGGRRDRSSAFTWSSAARPRCSSSTTPTWTS